jgi:hypothetical protein
MNYQYQYQSAVRSPFQVVLVMGRQVSLRRSRVIGIGIGDYEGYRRLIAYYAVFEREAGTELPDTEDLG